MIPQFQTYSTEGVIFIWNPSTESILHEFTHFSPKWKKQRYLSSQIQALLIIKLHCRGINLAEENKIKYSSSLLELLMQCSELILTTGNKEQLQIKTKALAPFLCSHWSKLISWSKHYESFTSLFPLTLFCKFFTVLFQGFWKKSSDGLHGHWWNYTSQKGGARKELVALVKLI